MQKNHLLIVLAFLNCAHTTHAVEKSNPGSEENATTRDTRLHNLTPNQRAKVDEMKEMIKDMYAPLWKKLIVLESMPSKLLAYIDNGMVLGYRLTPDEKKTLRSLWEDSSSNLDKETVHQILNDYPERISIPYAVLHSLDTAYWGLVNKVKDSQMNPMKLLHGLCQLFNNLNTESDSTQRDDLIAKFDNRITETNQMLDAAFNSTTEAEKMYIPIVKQMYGGPMWYAYQAARDPNHTPTLKKIAKITPGPFQHMIQTYL